MIIHRLTPKRAVVLRVVVVLIVILFWVLNPLEAWTAEITKISGSGVVISDIDANPGDVFFAEDSDGKRKALIEITRVNKNNSKAAGRVSKGSAKVGYTLVPRGTPRRRASRHSGLAFGAMGGYSLDTMSVPLQNSTLGINTTVTLTGGAISIKGAADYAFGKNLGARLSGGYEAFSVDGSANSNRGVLNYGVEIGYLTLGALGRYIFLPGSMGLWAGAGIGFAIPFSKSTNILAEDSIATATLLTLAGGADVAIGPNWYIPLQVDYSLFLPATDVKTSIIGFRAGIMMKF